MNRHFKDAWYYLGRTVFHVRAGLSEQLSPIETRVRKALGREVEQPQVSRVETVKAELRELPSRVAGEAREVTAEARHRVRGEQSDDIEQPPTA
ncbi:DUF7553 family protein [Halalkalirubrum salinum]|uniref:DUF7553 family protein n=1 Tax=Halalkalirubrum salinum TaxID=2563889 RepID=UPI0010FB6DDB|nr:hypothetical protein [Halalkalirubrum salinum]